MVGSAFRKAVLGRLTPLRRMTIKKAEHQRIDAFELWCWRRLESLLDCKEMQGDILKEIGPEYSIGRTDDEAEAPVLWPPDMKT